MEKRRIRRGLPPKGLGIKVRIGDPGNYGFRTGIFVRRNPVLTACLIALVIVSIPIFLIVQQQKDQQQNREATALAICQGLNAIGLSMNGQNLYLQQILIESTRGTKAFDKQLTALGLPPYEKRLAQAEAQAHSLQSLAVPTFICSQFIDFVKSNHPPSGSTLPIPTASPRFPAIHQGGP